MASASPSAIQAISDRSLLERVEAKGSGPSDGQFASLMARFHKVPATTKSPEPAPPRPVKPDKPTTSAQTSIKPQVSTNSADPARKVDGPDRGAAPQDSQATGSNPDVAPKASRKIAANTKVDRAKPGTPPSADPAASNGSSVTTDATAALPPVCVVALKGGGEEDALAAMPPQATPQPSDPGTPALQFTGALPDPTLATGSPTPSVPSATPSPSTPGDEAVTGNDPAFITPPGKAQVSAQDQTLLAPVQADPQVPPPTDPDHLKPQPTPQAAVAELASQAKAAPIPERTGPSGRMPTAEATAAATLTRHADAPIPSDHSAEAQNSPSAGTQFSEAELQPSAENGKAATAFAISPSAAATTAEALAVKPSALAQTPVLHGADGSAMALTSILPRAGATAATPAAAATPASATQPSVAVIQVEGGLRWMLKGGAQEAQLQLHPDSLGQVTIHLKVVGSEVHARLWITEPGSVQAVQEGRSHLEASLREQGLQLGSFDLQQGQRPFQEAPSAASFHEPATLDPTTARQEAPLSASISILNPHHVELYA